MPTTYAKIAKTSVALGALLSLLSASARAAQTGLPRITILVYNYAAVPKHTLEWAEAVAAGIFLHAGIETSWRSCLADASEPNRGSCPSIDASTPVLRIQRQFQLVQNKVHADTMGFCVGSLATVSFQYAEQLAAAGLGTTPEILGHLAAHEIGHIWLPGHAHTVSGIMKSRWSLEDWTQIQQCALFFTTQQARLMQRDLKNANDSCIIQDVERARKLDLDRCRPAPVSIEEKARAVYSLPTEGEITRLREDEWRKLEAIEPVLRAHKRIGVYEVKVISVPQAWTGLYGRAVLLISLPALRLVTSDELAALVAHEIGHEYVWQQFVDAKARRDTRRLRELELICDAIAVRMLVLLGRQPTRLQTAIEKTTRYNRERLGVPLNEGDYPSLNARKRLLKDMSLLEK